MAAYYSGPRIRLPSNRSLQLSDVSGSHSPPARDRDNETTSARDAYTHSHSPVLIFPTAPSSEPASPHPRVARLRHLRLDSTSSSSRARVRVDSNTTDLSFDASSLLASPSLVEVPSAPFSLASSWDLSPTGTSPLTRDRIVRLGSARVIPSWPSSGSAEVELWSWTSTSDQGQEEREDEGETQYDDAVSQFHFPTLEQSRGLGPDVRGGLGLMKKGGFSQEDGLVVAHAALGEQNTVQLPLRFILETILGIDRAVLRMLEYGGHEPEFISETAIFGMQTRAEITDEEIEPIENERIWPSLSLLCVWAEWGFSKWRTGQR